MYDGGDHAEQGPARGLGPAGQHGGDGRAALARVLRLVRERERHAAREAYPCPHHRLVDHAGIVLHDEYVIHMLDILLPQVIFYFNKILFFISYHMWPIIFSHLRSDLVSLPLLLITNK